MTAEQNTLSSRSVTLRQAALVAGVSSLTMFVAAMVAEFYARQSLIIPGNATLTAQNVLSHPGTFAVGICGYIAVLICDVLAAWALYIFLKPAHAQLSLLTACFRLFYTAMFGAALFGLVNGFRTLVLNPASTEQAMAQFQTFDDGWSLALVFFGVHLFLLGYLIFKSGYMPKTIGVLLMVAAFGYAGDNLCKLFSPDYENYKVWFAPVVAIAALLGEVGLAIWFLVKGRKVQV